MDVRVMGERLPPGVQHGDDAELGAEVPWIGGDPAQCLGRGPEQDGVDRPLVLEGDLGNRGRQREDDMEVCHGQQLRSEEHPSELQSLMRISYAVFCLKKKTTRNQNTMTRNKYNRTL